MLLLPNCETAEFTHICGDANINKKAKGEIVTVDLLWPLHDKSRSHILICIDVFTKAVHLYTIMRPVTNAILRFILEK